MLLSRGEGSIRNISFLAEAVHAHCLQSEGEHRLKSVFGGIRLLEMDDRAGTYRIVQVHLHTGLCSSTCLELEARMCTSKKFLGLLQHTVKGWFCTSVQRYCFGYISLEQFVQTCGFECVF